MFVYGIKRRFIVSVCYFNYEYYVFYDYLQVEFLDEKEDEMIVKIQKEVDEWDFQSRIKNYEFER